MALQGDFEPLSTALDGLKPGLTVARLSRGEGGITVGCRAIRGDRDTGPGALRRLVPWVDMTVLPADDRASSFLTVAEVAHELRCSEPTVRRRIRAGELPAVRLGRGRNSAVRVPEAGLRAWLWSQPEEERS